MIIDVFGYSKIIEKKQYCILLMPFFEIKKENSVFNCLIIFEIKKSPDFSSDSIKLDVLCQLKTNN